MKTSTTLRIAFAGALSIAAISTAHAQSYGPRDEGRRFNDGSRVVCKNVEVQRNSRDPNRIAGTATGAIIGGLVGSQVGSGNGRKAGHGRRRGRWRRDRSQRAGQQPGTQWRPDRRAALRPRLLMRCPA